MLFKALKQSMTIQIVRFGKDDHALNDTFAELLGELVQQNHIIKGIHVSGSTDVCDVGIISVVNGLEHNNTIENVSLKGSVVGNDGAISLMKRNKPIKYLEVAQHSFGIDGRNALFDGVRNNFAVESFAFETNDELRNKLTFYTRLNTTANREILRINDGPTNLWSHVLAKVGSAGYYSHELKAYDRTDNETMLRFLDNQYGSRQDVEQRQLKQQLGSLYFFIRSNLIYFKLKKGTNEKGHL